MNIEQEIQAKGLTAPRVTPADIDASVDSEHYFTAADALLEEWEDRDKVPTALERLTFCVLVLKNGFTVTGESACASPENFNAELGREIARENAVNKIWPLLGYELRTKLAKEESNQARLDEEASTIDRIVAINKGVADAAFSDDELVYAATSRCACGAGLAYPKKIGPSGAWHCSDILTLRAAQKTSPEAKIHTGSLPFTFYSIKSESQPSAEGATTRPAPTESEGGEL